MDSSDSEVELQGTKIAFSDDENEKEQEMAVDASSEEEVVEAKDVLPPMDDDYVTSSSSEEEREQIKNSKMGRWLLRSSKRVPSKVIKTLKTVEEIGDGVLRLVDKDGLSYTAAAPVRTAEYGVAASTTFVKVPMFEFRKSEPASWRDLELHGVRCTTNLATRRVLSVVQQQKDFGGRLIPVPVEAEEALREAPPDEEDLYSDGGLDVLPSAPKIPRRVSKRSRYIRDRAGTTWRRVRTLKRDIGRLFNPKTVKKYLRMKLSNYGNRLLCSRLGVRRFTKKEKQKSKVEEDEEEEHQATDEVEGERSEDDDADGGEDTDE
eukprot:Sspe_Gene.14704::Locus_5095_Transcript_1_1_Confidence_1.000_Length_1320::g.14704::m.14704